MQSREIAYTHFPLAADCFALPVARKWMSRLPDYAIPREALVELADHSDPRIRVWANAVLALGATDAEPSAIATLEQSPRDSGPTAELASPLPLAIRAPAPGRELRLEEIILWLRTHHPELQKIWQN